jgi:ribosomal protein S18 acetylase RimI-like enzyme
LNELTISSHNRLSEAQITEIGILVQAIRATGSDPRISLEWLAARDSTRVSDWLAYTDQQLVGVLSTSVFGDTVEATLAIAPSGPAYVAEELFGVLVAELPRQGATRMILLHDRMATALRQLAERQQLVYDHSEQVMCRPAALGRMTLVTPTPLSIRKARETEFQLVAHVIAQDWGGNQQEITDSLSKSFVRGGIHYYLATLDDAPVSALNIQWLEGRPWIYGFSVSQAYRGRGFGRQTLSYALADALDHSPGDAYLEVEPNNSIAVKLYQSLGFAVLRTFDYWAKELANGTNT